MNSWNSFISWLEDNGPIILTCELNYCKTWVKREQLVALYNSSLKKKIPSTTCKKTKNQKKKKV